MCDKICGRLRELLSNVGNPFSINVTHVRKQFWGRAAYFVAHSFERYMVFRLRVNGGDGTGRQTDGRDVHVTPITAS